MKSFVDFQKSGRNVRFSETNVDANTEFGRIYEGSCYIELMDDGMWNLTIERNEYTGFLGDLEKQLYHDWYVPEHRPRDKHWIYDEVIKVLDHAEGLGGPTGHDYVGLMLAVVRECQNRIGTYATSDQYFDDVAKNK